MPRQASAVPTEVELADHAGAVGEGAEHGAGGA